MERDRFVVIVKVSAEEGATARYALATRQVFPTMETAQTYADTCCAARDPLVVEGRWFSLRHASTLTLAERLA